LIELHVLRQRVFRLKRRDFACFGVFARTSLKTSPSIANKLVGA
jgi:hypothetical protein